MKAINYDDLDHGIRDVVAWLRINYFETTDSGDGVSKADLIVSGHALPFPHVFCVVKDASVLTSEAEVLLRLLRESGVQVSEGDIQASYDPVTGTAVLALMNVDNDRLNGGLS